MAEVVVVGKGCVPEVVPVELDPPSDIAGFAIPEVAPPKPENNDGAATPSFFSVVGAAGPVAVSVGWPPREKVDGAVDIPPFFSPSLFAAAPIFPKSPPPAAAVVDAALSPVAAEPPRVKPDWLAGTVFMPRGLNALPPA